MCSGQDTCTLLKRMERVGGGGRGEGGGHTQVNMLERALRSYAPKLVKNTAMNGSSLSVCAIVQKRCPLFPIMEIQQK